MKLDTAIAVSLCCALGACGEEELQKRELPRNPQPQSVPRDGDEGPSSCERVAALECSGATLSCANEAQGECILARADSVPGWCAIAGGNDICDGDAPSSDYAAHCRVQECYGDDFDACLEAGESRCAPPPGPTVCDEIAAIAQGCPGFGYDCPAFSEESARCFLELLRLMLQEVGDVCFMFDEVDARCANGAPTVEGFSSCTLQSCFGVDSYDSCMGTLELVCAFEP